MKVTWDERADPAVLEAFSTIEKFPAPNVWAGSGNVLNQISVLLPVTFLNDQFHAVGAFEEVSVNCTGSGAVPLVTSAVKLATGAIVAAETLMKVTWDERADPAVLEAFSTIEKFPAPKVSAGLCSVLHQISVLLPVTFLNDQFQDVGVLIEVSVNCTGNGAVPDVTSAVKLAIGAMVAAETLMKVT
jgi:hypothetical protein